MAEFTQRQNVAQPPNFTGYSQGIRSSPNTAIGTLFEGLANTLAGGVREADRNIKANIQQDVFDEVDAARAEFGVPEATDMEAQPLDARMAQPREIERAQRQLQSLQAAVQQGTLRESNYWARMNNVVRQLRGKYPGYRAEIDAMVASITGANPANALRSSLMSEWEAQSRQSKSSMDSLVDWATKQGYLPADFIERQGTDNPYTYAELQAHISARTTTERELDNRMKELARQKEINALTEQSVKQNAKSDAVQIVTTLMGDMSGAIGRTKSEVDRRLQEAQRAAQEGRPIDQATVDQIRPMVAQLRADLTLALHQRMTTPWSDEATDSYSAHLKPEEVKAIIEEALTPVTIMEQAIGDPTYGVLGSLANWYNAQKLDSQREVLRDLPFTRDLLGITSVMGAESAADVLKLVPRLQGEVWQAMIDHFSTRNKPGGSAPNASIPDDLQTLEDRGAPVEAKNALVEKWTNLINTFNTPGELPQEVYDADIRYMFSPASMRVWSLLDNESAFAYFAKVASPAVSKKMREMRDRGGEDNYRMYQQFVASSFQNLFMQKVKSLQELHMNPNYFEVTWDEVNSRFKIRTKVTADYYTNYQNNPVRGEFDSLNSAIQVIKPILDDEGGDVNLEILNLLYTMGYNPEEQGVMTRFGPGLATAIWNAIKGRLTQGGGTLTRRDTGHMTSPNRMGPN